MPDSFDEYHLRLTVFYRWLKRFFENGAAAFQPMERPGRCEEAKRRGTETPEGKTECWPT